MTISLEEHVARAISAIKCDNVMEEDQHGCIASGSCHCLDYARAAISATSEYGEPANGVCNKCGYCGPVERHGFDQGRHPKCNYAASIVPPPDPASIRESERAACEAIAREGEDKTAWNDYGAGELYAAGRIADAIAARKGKGEGRSDVLAEEPSDDGAGDRA